MGKSKSLDRYFKSIQNLNPLKKEEEIALARKAQLGDTCSLEKLVKHNLKIVVTIANKNVGRGILVEDLIQQGNLGLYEASLRYDPEAGVRFATYAGMRVLKSMNALIDTCGRIVRIPVNQEYQRYLKIKSGEEVKNMTPVKLDDFVSDESGKTKGDYLLSQNPEIEDEFEHDFFKVQVTSLLSRLNDRDRQIVELYYGVDQDEALTTKEIAAEIGLTQIRVCQILSASKKKMAEDVKDLIEI